MGDIYIWRAGNWMELQCHGGADLSLCEILLAAVPWVCVQVV